MSDLTAREEEALTEQLGEAQIERYLIEQRDPWHEREPEEIEEAPAGWRDEQGQWHWYPRCARCGLCHSTSKACDDPT